MRARLISQDGGPSIDLTKDMILVGRNEDCDIRLNHKSISKLHCVIVKTDGLLLLRDLGSTNGTRLNGVRLGNGQWPLRVKDLLQVGEVSFVVDRRRGDSGYGFECISLRVAGSARAGDGIRIERARMRWETGRLHVEPGAFVD